MIKLLRFAVIVSVLCVAGLNAENVYHTVRRGENLSSIASRYNVTVSSIMALNNIRTSVIHPNQRLLVRRGGSSRTSAQWGHETINYRVNRGDNLWNISRQFNVSVSDIRRWNNLRSDTLSIGQNLRINVPRTLPHIENPSPITSVSERVYYTVQKGETIEGVAGKFGISPEDLKRANLLNDEDFKEGQIIVIPSRESLSEDDVAENEQNKELSIRENIIKDAFSFLGMPYRLGGSGVTSIDCSTLTRLVYANSGLSLSNVSYLQFREGEHIDISEAVAGDLVFFRRRGHIGHVGIYIGNNLFIHASQTNNKVTIASLDNSFFKRTFVSARRYIPVEETVLARRFANFSEK